jgi:hypothetical protein
MPNSSLLYPSTVAIHKVLHSQVKLSPDSQVFNQYNSSPLSHRHPAILLVLMVVNMVQLVSSYPSQLRLCHLSPLLMCPNHRDNKLDFMVPSIIANMVKLLLCSMAFKLASRLHNLVKQFHSSQVFKVVSIFLLSNRFINLPHSLLRTSLNLLHSCSRLQTLRSLAISNSQHTSLMLSPSSSHTLNTITPTVVNGQVFSLFTLASSRMCLPRTVTTAIIMCLDITLQQLKFMEEFSHSKVQYTVSTNSLPRHRSQVLLMFQLCQFPQEAPPQSTPSMISMLIVQDRHAEF